MLKMTYKGLKICNKAIKASKVVIGTKGAIFVKIANVGNISQNRLHGVSLVSRDYRSIKVGLKAS